MHWTRHHGRDSARACRRDENSAGCEQNGYKEAQLSRW